MKKSIGRIITCVLIGTLLIVVFGCRNTATQDTDAISGGVTPKTTQGAGSEDTATSEMTTKEATLPAITSETSATVTTREEAKETTAESKDSSQETEPITEPTAIKDIFPDEELAAAICTKLGKFSVDDTVTQADLDTITTFSSGDFKPSSAVGIGHMRSLTSLEFANTSISSLPAEIGNLTSLEHLIIWGCPLSSLPP